MAVSFVKKVGLSQVSAGVPSVTVPAAGVALGNFLIAVFSCNGANAIAGLALSDTGGNTYQNDKIQDDNTGAIHVAIVSAKVTTALVSGNAITLSVTTAGAQRSLGVYEFSGLATTTWLDVTNGAGATSTAPNSGNLITTAASDMLFGACAYNLASGGYAPGATGGNTPIEEDDAAIGTSASKSFEAMHIDNVDAAGTYTANGTIASAAWVQAGATYKAAGAAAVLPPGPVVVDFAVTRAANY